MVKDVDGESRWTAPNVLCAVRLLGCPVLLYLAYHGYARLFVYLFVFLILTDWIDGKLARWLDQRSAFGARLDSVADATTYGTVLVSAWWLVPDVILNEWPWIAAALVSYLISVVASLARFRRMSAYHTRSAKICWFLNAVGVLCVFADISVWPFRVAMIGVTCANLEAAAITLVLRGWRADISSLIHAWRLDSASSDA